MKFEFLFLGKTKDKYLDLGISEYSSRLKHYTSLSIKYLKPRQRKNWSGTECMEYEAKLLRENIPKGSLVVTLDSSGKQYTSEEIAERIGKWQQRGARQVSFLIGGSLGLSEDILKTSDEVISLSKMTFTHDMVRLFLLEQIYRAFTIRNGEKYHK